MGVKAKVVEASADFAAVPLDQPPPGQAAEFAEYRDFLSAFCVARLWWMDLVSNPRTDPALRFWFSTKDRTIVCYALMKSWNSGYWPSRHELGEAARAVNARTVTRVLKDAENAGFCALELHPEDGRARVVKPTRATIIAFETATTEYFMVLAESSPTESVFGQGWRAHVKRILSLEPVRLKMGFSLRKK